MKINLPNVTLIGIDCVNIERAQKALDISSLEINFADVKLLTSLPTDDSRKTEINPLNSIEAFSEFCIKDLYKFVDTEFALLVQYDGFVLNSESWSDEFLKYDYIGAPWLVADWAVNLYNFPEKLRGKRIVGNGGFSIRSKKFFETSARLAQNGSFEKYHPEDLILCVFDRGKVEKEGILFAPPELAAKFSVEGDDEIYEKQFGFHNLKWTDITKWINENSKWGIEQILK